MSVKLVRPRSFCHDHSRPFSDISRGWLISVSLALGCRVCSQPLCENKNLTSPQAPSWIPPCVPVPECATHTLPPLCDSPWSKLISCRVIAAHDHSGWTAAHQVTHLSNKDFLFCFFPPTWLRFSEGRSKRNEWKTQSSRNTWCAAEASGGWNFKTPQVPLTVEQTERATELVFVLACLLQFTQESVGH